MTNEEKITELCKYYEMNCDWFMEALEQMAEWKEKQMIEKACKEHCNCCAYAYMACRRYNYDNLHCRHYVKFKKTMEEK